MRAKSDLRGYQRRAIQFGIAKRFAAFFIDMGLGKTIIALSAIQQLINQGKVQTVLIVAPLRVCQAVWRQEALEWQHTRGLVFSLVQGSPAKRLAALQTPAHIYLINPELLLWLAEYYGRHPWPFDMLVVDESSMFKRLGRRWKALRRGLRYFKRRLIMTGTPTPGSLLELWPQMFIVDKGYSLGASFTVYKRQYFYPGGYRGYVWTPHADSEQAIINAVGPRVVRLDADDWITLPKLIEVPIWVEMPDNVRNLYRRIEREKLLQFETMNVEAVNAAALTNKCSQIAQGSIFGEDKDGKRAWTPLHDVKLLALRELVDELQGEPPIILYRFTHDLHRLRAMFPTYKVISDNIEHTVKQWNNGGLDGLLGHPLSASHGLNLQHGGRHIIWFAPTWSLEQYVQAIKRVHRSGQTKPVIVYLILMRGTTDEAIVEAIAHKRDGQRSVNNALREYYNERYKI